MEVTRALVVTLRGNVREHLALLADFEGQRKYERDVPIADVPAELVCGWFDDSYYPDSPAFQAAFLPAELTILRDFNACFQSIQGTVPDPISLTELQAMDVWRQLADAARSTLAAIPEELPTAVEWT
jgi:hypothetical protein